MFDCITFRTGINASKYITWPDQTLASHTAKLNANQISRGLEMTHKQNLICSRVQCLTGTCFYYRRPEKESWESMRRYPVIKKGTHSSFCWVIQIRLSIYQGTFVAIWFQWRMQSERPLPWTTVTLTWLYLPEVTMIQSVSDQQECLECSKQMLLVCYFT